jgi:iron complex transport system substrate-binding protein
MLPATQTDTVVCNEARGVAVNHDIALPCTDDRRRSAWQRLLGLAAVLLLPISLAAAPPQRIVSMNVCTDQLLLDLVSRERIASLSYIAADPRTSAIANDVQGLHLNHGSAEEIVSLAPDLILTGEFGLRPTVTVLRRLGYSILEIPMAETLTDIERNIVTLGVTLGVEARAAALVAGFRHRLEQLSYRGDGPRSLFVNYDANGWSTGQTGLLADIVHRAGLATPGDSLGFEQASKVSLETLLLLRPALIDLGYPWDDPPALATELRRHPALIAVMRSAESVEIPDSAWLCGTAHSLDALEQLRNAHDTLARGSHATR